MKNDFNKKARLLQDQAAVMNLQFDAKFSARFTEKNEATGEARVVKDETYTAAEACDKFFEYFATKKTPYEIFAKSENEVFFAVSKANREKAFDAIREFQEQGGVAQVMRGFGSSARLDGYDAVEELQNKLLKPFSPVRREVAAIVAKL